MLTTTQHHFAERQLAFYFFLVVQQYGTTPCGNKGQPVLWCPQQALNVEEFPRLRVAIIRQLMANRSGAVS
ncbi:hypothetical protein [Sodalis-like endosymbiont of Proechinophthirus fluctus]|uniref:hypothetical protein n=1 Tax=Sodalis-like endosymbiont of Proechinophthirus fluctus TaxID=1462730 RepID=UPI000A530186